jgi:hypothetical protein
MSGAFFVVQSVQRKRPGVGVIAALGTRQVFVLIAYMNDPISGGGMVE